MKAVVEMAEALRYKLVAVGAPIDGPVSVFCENEAAYKNTILLESVLKKKHHPICYHCCREAVASQTIQVTKEEIETNLSDLFTQNHGFNKKKFLAESVYILKG